MNLRYLDEALRFAFTQGRQVQLFSLFDELSSHERSTTSSPWVVCKYCPVTASSGCKTQNAFKTLLIDSERANKYVWTANECETVSRDISNCMNVAAIVLHYIPGVRTGGLCKVTTWVERKIFTIRFCGFQTATNILNSLNFRHFWSQEIVQIWIEILINCLTSKILVNFLGFKLNFKMSSWHEVKNKPTWLFLNKLLVAFKCDF